MTASFPSSVPTTSELRGDLGDNVSTLLSAGIGAVDTTINVDDTSDFPSAGLASLVKASGSGLIEVFSYTGKTATSFTGVTRNFNGKGADSYAEDDGVHQYWVADHHNRHVEESIAIAQYANDCFGLGGPALLHQSHNGSTEYRIETEDADSAAFISFENPSGARHEIGIETQNNTGGGRYAGEANSLNLHVNSAVSVTTNAVSLLITREHVGSTLEMQVFNTDNVSSASNARVYIRSNGASAGDPMLVWNVSGATHWAMGIDNSNSDYLVITEASTVGGANNRMIMETGGDTFWQGDAIQLGITRVSNGRQCYITPANNSGGMHLHAGPNGGGETGNVAFEFRSDAPSANTLIAQVLANGQWQFLAGTVGTPSIAFNSNTGLYRSGANAIDVSCNGVRSAGFSAVSTADNQIHVPVNFYGGGGGTSSKIAHLTADVSTSAVNIMATTNGLVMVYGTSGGTNAFFDLVQYVYNAAPNVVASYNVSGAPAARTYGNSGVSGFLTLQMASGTYEVSATAFDGIRG